MTDAALPAGFAMDEDHPPLPQGFTVDQASPQMDHGAFADQLRQMVREHRSPNEIDAFAAAHGYEAPDPAQVNAALKFGDATVLPPKAPRAAPAPTPAAPAAPGGIISKIGDWFAQGRRDQQAMDDLAEQRGGLSKFLVDQRHALDNTMTGIGEGIASLPDLAIKGVGKAMGAGARALGWDNVAQGLDNPVTFGGIVRGVTGAPEEPADVPSQYVRAGSRGLGGLLFGLGTGGMMARSASPVVANVGKVLTSNPGAQLAGTVTGSGASETVKQLGGGPVPQMIAGIVGGGAGTAATEGTVAAANAARNVLTDRGAAIRAGTTLAEHATNAPGAVAAIEAAAPAASGAQPTLAEVTRDPGLAGYQRSFASTNIRQGGQIATRDQANTSARLAALDKAAGEGDPNAIPTAAQAQGQALSGTARTSADATGPAAYPETSGAAAREAIDAAHAGAKGRTSTAYNAPELTARTPVDVPSSFYDALRGRLATFYGDAGGHVPAELSQIMDDLAGDVSNSNGLANIDRRLADFAGRQRAAGANREAAFAESLRHDLGTATDDMLPAEQRAALAVAKAARRDQADTFETGAVGKVTSREQYGRPTTADSSVPQVLIPKGRAGGEAVAQLVKSVGPEQAESIAREEIRRQMDAANSAADMMRVRNGFAPVLRQFPDLAADVEKAHGDMALSEAFGSTPLGRFADPAKTPAQVVGAMLDAKDGGKALGGLVSSLQGKAAALGGLRRSIADYVTGASKTSAVNAAGDQVASNAGALKALRTALDKAQGTALFDPKQAQALRALQGEMEGAQFANTANRTAGSDTARNATLSAASKLAGHSRTVRVARVALDLLNNEAQTNAFIGKAILDPQFAAELIRNVPQQQARATAQRLVAAVVGSSEAQAANAVDQDADQRQSGGGATQR